MKRINNITITLLLGLCFAFCSLYTNGQEKSHKKINVPKKLSLARYAFETKNYYAAIDLYLELAMNDSLNPEYSFRLGELYAILREYDEAEKWYGSALKTDSAKYPIKELKYAGMLERNGKYADAKKMLLDFINTYNDTNVTYCKILANKELDNCNFALAALKDTMPRLIEVKNMGNAVNSANSDFAPVPVDSSDILYSSLKVDNPAVSAENDGDNLTRFYLATKNDSGNYTVNTFFPEVFSDGKMHTANGAFSGDGTRFYFTRCNCLQSGKPVCSIYVSNKQNNVWQEPVKLGIEINVDGYTSTQPAIGYSYKKEELLYFVSDRPKGTGGYDIWYSVVSGGKTYSEAANAGKNINTGFDETTPFFDSKNNTLYFSSDGYPGFGGLDIFKSKQIRNKWDKPVNPGKPFNSGADDFYYVNTVDDSTGYLVSNRKSELNDNTCCDDIYKFERVARPKPLVFALKGRIYGLNDSTGKVIDDLILKLSDCTTGEVITDTVKNNSFFFKLKPKTNYVLSVKSATLTGDDVLISTKGLIRSDTLNVEMGLKRKYEKNKVFTFNDIYFDFDKATLRPESVTVLDSLVSIVAEILMNYSGIEISAHTDSKGNDAYNLRLSQQRANSVVEYLANKGIDKNKLKPKGYGETKPVAPNTNPDGSDNPDGRQMNRRVELKIL